MPTDPPPDDAPTPDAPQPKLTRKEQARRLRRATYLKAKEQRANDPRFIAIKEAMKIRRREAYQAAKERKKAAVAKRQAETRAARDAALNELSKIHRHLHMPAAATPPRTTHARRGRDGSRASSITVELDRFCTRAIRQLGWKAFMVFQRSVILAIDRERPDSLAALARIPGLGPSRVARFGNELVAIVRRYGGGRTDAQLQLGE